MALNLTAKKAVVEELAAVTPKAVSAVIVSNLGIKANQMTALRAQARNENVYLQVVKNTLAQRAFKETDFDCLSDSLVGPLLIALSMEAPSDAARLLKNFIKTCDKLEVKALSVGGNLYPANQLDQIASLPTREEALSKLLYLLKAPIEKFARTLTGPQVKLVRVLAAVKAQKPE